jgi:stage II sporulation protein D
MLMNKKYLQVLSFCIVFIVFLPLYSFEPGQVRVRILEKYHPAAVIISDSENRDEGVLIDERSNFPVEFPFSRRYEITIPGKDFKRGYKGRLILEWDKNELLIVNEVPLEDYVASVVLSEMGWTETEAMRAQAVLARTWAVAHRRANHFYDFDDLAYHQVYKGLFPQSKLTLQRLSETYGQVLTYRGKPIEVFYHAQCADRVFSAYEIWGKRDIPYLKKVELPPVLKRVRGDNTWERVLSKQAVDAVFSGEPGAASSFRYRKAVKNGQLGVYVNDCWLGIDNFRLRINRVLGWNQVKSNDFSIRVIGDKIVFQGRGFGHLVGLGQRDAIFLARQGYDYKRILKLFYPMAWGTYMLRSSVVLVFIRLRVKARAQS